jgi:hypothetical protein
VLDFRPDNNSNITDPQVLPTPTAHTVDAHMSTVHAKMLFCTVAFSAYRDCTHSKHAFKPFTPYALTPPRVARMTG